MPWWTAPCVCSGSAFFPSTGLGSTAGLPNLGLCPVIRVDGWSSVGDAAALASILLIVLAVQQLVTHGAGGRLPLAGGALLVAYLAAGVAVQTALEGRNDARIFAASGNGAGGIHVHSAYGMYVGLAGAVVAFLGAVSFARPWSPRAALLLPAAGLAVALLLPWEHGAAAPRLSQIGLASPTGAVAGVLATALVAGSLGAGRGTSPLLRVVALGSAFFALAALDVGFAAERAYGAWVGLAFAVLVAAAGAGKNLAQPRPPPKAAEAPDRPHRQRRRQCRARSTPPARAGSRCVSTGGFGLGVAGSAALVATLGFELEHGTQAGARLSFGYGAFVGFVAAGALVATALVPLAGPRLVLDLVPVAGALAYLTVVAVPWWGVLPLGVWDTFLVALARVSWLTVASALLALRLAALWRRPGRSRERVAVSLALVAVTLLDTLPLPTVRLTWNMAVLLGLAAPLAVHALVEASGGWRGVRVPEILRVDRIS